MKQLLLFVCCIVFTASALLAQPITPPYIRIGGFFNTSTNQVEGGTTYTHNQTVWVDCGTSAITVSVPIFPAPYGVIWGSSSTFTRSAVGGIDYIQTVQLDPNKGDGFISVVYVLPPYPYTSAVMSINIKQKPSVPAITGTSICAGNSATFTATSTYGLQSTKPMSILWETTGGVTVNGSSSFTSPPGTTSSVTIANSSSGTYSARAVVASCSNLQTLASTGNLGAPTIKNPIYWLFDPGSNMWQFSQISEAPAVTYSFSVASGSASIIQNSGDAYITTTSGASICVSGTNGCGTGTPYCFYIPASGGMLKSVSPNPAQDVVLVELNNAEKMEFLPAALNLYQENSTKPVKSISVSELYERKAFVDGNKVSLSVADLPRGVYYLHAIPAQGSKLDAQKTRIILK